MRAFFLYKTVIGLEITPSHIKLLQVKKTKNDVVILHRAQEKIDKSGRKATLQRLLKPFQHEKLPLAMAIPFTACITKSLPVTYELSRKEWQREFDGSLPKYLENVSPRAHYDFSIIDTLTQKTLYLQAVSTKIYQAYARDIGELQLNIKIIDIDAYAIVRAFEYFFPQMKEPEIRAIFFLNDESLQFLVCDQHQVIYFSEATFTDMLITMQAMMEAFYSHSIHCEIHMTYLMNLPQLIDEATVSNYLQMTTDKITSLSFADKIYPLFEPSFACCFGLTLRNFSPW